MMSNDYGIGGLFTLLFTAIPFAILGVWKLIDIIIWVLKNINITIG